MGRHVALVRTDVTVQRIAHTIRVTRIGEEGVTLAVTSNGSTLHAFLRSVLRLLLTANVVPTSPILVTLIMEAMRSSVTSVLTRATRRHPRRRHSLMEMQTVLPSTITRGAWSSSRTNRFTHWVKLGRPQVSLKDMKEWEFLRLTRFELTAITRSYSPSQSLYRPRYCGT
jgi:hypothetical protein